MYPRQNMKEKGSNIISCVPNDGKCPMGCIECFFNNDFRRTYKSIYPNPLLLQPYHIVRVADGHDAGINKTSVIWNCRYYDKKFYNTSIPDFDLFDGPVVYTTNARKLILPTKGLNMLMAVRFRVDGTEQNFIDYKSAIKYYKNIPLLLTIMRYQRKVNVPDLSLYNYIKSRYRLKKETILQYINLREKHPLLYVCDLMGLHCQYCNNCENLYYSYFSKKYIPQDYQEFISKNNLLIA